MADNESLAIDVWLGCGLSLLLHVLQIPMSVVSRTLSFALIGVSQLLYIVPAILIAKKVGRPGIAKGLIIGASLLFLLNAACFGLLFTVYPPWR